MPEGPDERIEGTECGGKDKEDRRHRVSPGPVGSRRVGPLLAEDDDSGDGEAHEYPVAEDDISEQLLESAACAEDRSPDSQHDDGDMGSEGAGMDFRRRL